jgi:transglutaminase-like putative cysteine protease
VSVLAAPPSTSPHLDVRNVLWLLAAMAFVIAPHVPRLPAWVGLFCGVVVAWRAWIGWSAWHFPARWLVVVITIAAAVGTYLTYGRLFGREAGTTLLLVMTALKLLEMRTQREVVLCVYIGFFLVITNFLFSQAIPLGIYMLACVWIFIAVLIGFNRVGRPPTLGERLRPAGALLLQSIPLMVAFFILFPRIQGPLWALPTDSRGGQSGLSDSMTPGNISNLIKSDAVAFRVQFHGDMPKYSQLYWRGPVLVDFDGATWRMPAFGSQGRFDYPKKEQLVRYTVTLEPHQKTWLFALDAPAMVPPNAYMLSDLELRHRRPVVDRLHYDMASYVVFQYGVEPNPAQAGRALQFEEERNPRTVALGRQWAREDPDPRSILAKAGQLFSTRFTYTLEPPTLDPRSPYDDFLFNTRQGFCEHYAGSFVLLMRAAGIPARVVTGYQGGEVNPINRELIVRQADAHAWAEIWTKGEGWVRIDPTAVVSPLRVDGGVNAALGPIGLNSTIIAADPFGLLAQVRFAWQALNSNWDQWVVGYNIDRQRQFFSQMGFPTIDWRTLAFWLLIATGLVGGGVSLGLLVRDRPPRREAALVAWDRFCRKMAAAGLAREPHEGPIDYLARVESERPQAAAEAEDIVRRYVAARYGAGATREELKELGRRVRAFRPA